LNRCKENCHNMQAVALSDPQVVMTVDETTIIAVPAIERFCR